jgi:hypothetical protein
MPLLPPDMTAVFPVSLPMDLCLRLLERRVPFEKDYDPSIAHIEIE